MIDPDNLTQFARQCAYDGQWYCQDCHDGEKEHAIPSKILYEGDAKPYKVSLRSMWFLEHIKNEPIFSVDMMVGCRPLKCLTKKVD